MTIVLRIVEAVVGALVVIATVSSALRSTVLPRSTHHGLARWSLRLTRLVFRLRSGRSPTYERRDRVMAMLGPVSLLLLLGSWLVFTLAGFLLLFMATGESSAARALELSGSSIFTLGTTAASGVWRDLLAYVEAGLGLLLVTLLITYLPSIYGAFSRRENGVNLMRVRAGTPPQATTMLIRYWRIDEGNPRLSALWRTWEAWFTDVEETHTTFPVLSFFRSPTPEQSWIVTAGALLDGASMWLAAIDHPRDPDANLVIRTGFQTLRRIAELFDIPFEEEPRPDDPISIGRDEWDRAVDELADAGLPVRADRDAAWLAWRGWRVNYDTVLLELARMVEAPPAPWSSDRSPAVRRGGRLRRVVAGV